MKSGLKKPSAPRNKYGGGGGEAFYRGHHLEWVALLWLLGKGYWPLALRSQTPYGEVDLIVAGRGCLVAVEVKNRINLSQAMESLSAHQLGRLARALGWWHAKHPQWGGYSPRIDFVGLSAWRLPYHIENITAGKDGKWLG